MPPHRSMLWGNVWGLGMETRYTGQEEAEVFCSLSSVCCASSHCWAQDADDDVRAVAAEALVPKQPCKVDPIYSKAKDRNVALVLFLEWIIMVGRFAHARTGHSLKTSDYFELNGLDRIHFRSTCC